MANITADRVLETSITTGAGPYTLAGAVIGFKPFSPTVSSLDTFYYFAEDIAANGAPAGGWEVGLGTLNANGTIARTAIHASSNNNVAVVWAAGTRRIGIGLSAAQFTNISVSEINAATSLIQTQKIMAQIALRGQLS